MEHSEDKKGRSYYQAAFSEAASIGILSACLILSNIFSANNGQQPSGAAYAQSKDLVQVRFDDEHDYPIARVIPVESYFHEMASDLTEPVGIAFVFGIDISGSINSANNEYQSQLNSLAETIESSDFRQSIFMPGGHGSAAIMVADYGTASMLTLGWVDFRENDPARFQEVADIIRNIPRRESGITNHNMFLQNAIIGLDSLDQRWGAIRKLVVVKTDGTASGGIPSIAPLRQTLAERHGASISTLVTREPPFYEDGSYYSEDVEAWAKVHLTTPANTFIGPNGEFVPQGITLEVATELETQGADISSYRDRVLLAVRRLMLIQSSDLNIGNQAIQFAELGRF